MTSAKCLTPLNSAPHHHHAPPPMHRPRQEIPQSHCTQPIGIRTTLYCCYSKIQDWIIWTLYVLRFFPPLQLSTICECANFGTFGVEAEIVDPAKYGPVFTWYKLCALKLNILKWETNPKLVKELTYYKRHIKWWELSVCQGCGLFWTLKAKLDNSLGSRLK